MRILFASPYCLLDTSSGAARSVTTQLEELVRLGWSCRSMTLPVMDQPGRVEATAVLRAQGLRKVSAAKPPLWGMRRNGVEHIVVPCSESRRGKVPAQHEQVFFHLFRQQLREWQPDVVLGYGGLLLESAIFGEARRQGIRTVFYLANAEYRDAWPFQNVDRILTPSRALADLYRSRLGVEAQPIGSFTRLPDIVEVPQRSQRDRVTMVNPSPEKGLAYLLAIAEACQTRLPQTRIQVVESRGSEASVRARHGDRLDRLKNIEFVPHQPTLDAVLGRSRALLFPSLWFEAAGRTLLEAQAYGVPVLASRHGGNAEQLNGGGFLFDIDERSLRDFGRIPEADEVAPWVDCLATLTNDDAWEEASGRALAVARRRNLGRLAQGLSQTLTSLCQAGRHVTPPQTAAPAAP
jgi:glycosyltransferase involved in cell wall biosynthesis